MDYTNIDDNELFYLVKDVDKSYETEFYKKYKPFISKIAKAYSINYKLDFDDLIQEGYIGLNYAINNYMYYKDTMFHTYARTCIMSRINNYLRKEKQTSYIIPNTCISLYQEYNNKKVEDFISIGDVTYNQVINNYYNNELINLKNNFDILESQVFELRYNGFKYKEIAILLDIPLKSVNNIVKRIRRKEINNCKI